MKVKVKRAGATTYVTVIDDKRGITATGAATCAEGDVYSATVGEYVALHRALGNFRFKLVSTGKTVTISKADETAVARFVGRGDVSLPMSEGL